MIDTMRPAAHRRRDYLPGVDYVVRSGGRRPPYFLTSSGQEVEAMHVKIYLRLDGCGSGAVAHVGKWLCRPTDRATPEDKLYAEHGGNAGRVVPVGACGSQKCPKGR